MLKFKSEEEKDEAIKSYQELGPEDAPVGKDIDEFMSEKERELDELLHAEIDPEDTEDAEIPEESSATEETATETPSDNELLQRRAENLQKQRDDLIVENDDRIKKLEQTIEELKNQKTVEPQEQTDTEVDKIKQEIESLEQEMNGSDVDVYDDDYQKKTQKANRLYMKLNSILTKKTEQLYKEQEQKRKNLENEQKLEREKNEKDKNAQLIERSIEEFRTTIPELKGRKYNEMDRDYAEFAVEVASEYYSKPMKELSDQEIEIAMQKYLTKSPILIENLNAKGIKAPADLKQYITLSEINALKDGFVLNKVTGDWERLKDSKGNNVIFPNHKAALNYLKDERGDRYKELLEAEQKATDGLINAINKRSDVVELDDDHKGVNLTEMSDDEALRILEKYDEDTISIRARKNFDDPLVQEYNKALAKRGYATISKKDFE